MLKNVGHKIKLYTPNTFKMTKIHRCNVYMKKKRVLLNCRLWPFHTPHSVGVMIIVEDTSVTVKCRKVIKALFLDFNLCLIIKSGDSLSCSFTSTFLSY